MDPKRILGISALLILSLGTTLTWTTPSSAQPMVCSGDGRSCEVWEEADLRLAAADPSVEEIVLKRDIELTAQGGAEDSLDIADSNDGGVRHLEIRSDDDDPSMAHALWSTEEPMTLLKCWAHDSPIELRLRDVVLDGMETCIGALWTDTNCSVSLDSVTARGFRLGEEGVGDAPATLFWSNAPGMDVRHCRFEDIEGTVLGVGDGQLAVSQSLFTNCRGHDGPGAIWIGDSGNVTLKGNLFWGCTTDGSAGGAIAAQGNAGLTSWADAFVANRAPSGGAIQFSGQTIHLIGTTFAGNGTCTQGGCTASTVPSTAVPQGSCNFAWLENGGVLIDDLELPVFGDSEGDVGEGGALALDLFRRQLAAIEVLKCLFLGNRARAGGAIHVRLEAVAEGRDGDAAEEEENQAAIPVQIVHNTFASNSGIEGAAVAATLVPPKMMLAAGNLWLDHDTLPLVAGDDQTRLLLVDNHTDGPPLATGIEQVHSTGDTCGARPAEDQLVACPTGCGAEFQEYFCGGPVPGQWEDAVIVTPLHFGEELCPVETVEACDSTADDDCEPIDGPCVSGAGSTIVDSLDVGSAPADRGMTGHGCGSSLYIVDSDGDGTPDIAECDADDDPNPPSMDEARHPFAAESCNGLDDNCDGEVDEGLLLAWYRDEDGDGHGGGDAVMLCEPTDGLFASATDCDDENPDAFPGSVEIHDDGVDNDCDGVIDLDAPGCHSAGCLATRVAPSDDGLNLGWGPGLPLGLWLGWRLSGRRGRQQRR